MWPASSDAGIDLPEGAHSTVWAVCTDSLVAGDCMDLQATASLAKRALQSANNETHTNVSAFDAF
ncbi:MAG TPA: hypothetical protein DCG06_03450 [Deltaproteobacteria bacterium]|nr:hypothetical protein [Deltaproteobacteria bacterium]